MIAPEATTPTVFTFGAGLARERRRHVAAKATVTEAPAAILCVLVQRMWNISPGLVLIRKFVASAATIFRLLPEILEQLGAMFRRQFFTKPEFFHLLAVRRLFWCRGEELDPQCIPPCRRK